MAYYTVLAYPRKFMVSWMVGLLELNLAEAETVLKATDTALNIMPTRLFRSFGVDYAGTKHWRKKKKTHLN